MVNQVSLLLFFSYFICMLFCISADDDRKLYIVYMGSIPKGQYSVSSHHLSLLQQVVESRSAEDLLVTSYKRSFSGFAAKLSKNEAEKLASKMGVVSVFPSTTLQLQTTRSWDFVGLKSPVSGTPSAESDVIVGVIDSGIWPESESFNDKGFGPPPKKWKGTCSGGRNFTCNNKLIGARSYSSGNTLGTNSARDEDGHGTHTASTAAGNQINDATFFGVANGTARGGVPSARIAAYRACAGDGCNGADILAAFDDAIADGVDIITISIGFENAAPFDQDPIAIGAFHALAKGILTSHSAGNSGPQPRTISSVAPWLLSVAASSTDRKIIDQVVLGNGKTFTGRSINSFTLNRANYPLIHGSNASTTCEEVSARLCSDGCLDSRLVKGKIVVCDDYSGHIEALRAGAAGSIVGNGLEDVPFVVPFPTVPLDISSHEDVKSYALTTKNPVAKILKSSAIKDDTAPAVASFSSRGPNMIVSDILKPDISAPGVAILAAYPPISPSQSPEDKRQGKFNILSGTSMACPHVAGVAAYVKSFHLDWSPSAIKSAIITSASPMKPTTNPDAEFAYGAGQIDPSKAINPGLVYESDKADHIKLLCSLPGYDERKVRLISGDNSTCPRASELVSPKDLNYPSLSVRTPPNKPFRISFHRTVTNVGLANSKYTAEVATGSKLEVEVVPKVLTFKSINEKQSFNVTVAGEGLSGQRLLSASLKWSNGNITVRSPITVHTYEASV